MLSGTASRIMIPVLSKRQKMTISNLLVRWFEWLEKLSKLFFPALPTRPRWFWNGCAFRDVSLRGATRDSYVWNVHQNHLNKVYRAKTPSTHRKISFYFSELGVLCVFAPVIVFPIPQTKLQISLLGFNARRLLKKISYPSAEFILRRGSRRLRRLEYWNDGWGWSNGIHLKLNTPILHYSNL